MKHIDLFFKEDRKTPKAYYFVEKNLLKSYPNIYQEIKIYNKHLDCQTFQQELYHFLTENIVIPICPICNKSAKFKTYSIGYLSTCGDKSCHSKLLQQNKENNNLSKYGVKNVFQLDSVKQKVKDYQFEKYGDWQIKQESIDYKKNRTEESDSKLHQKMIKTNTIRYGENSILPHKHIKQKMFDNFVKKVNDKFANKYNIIKINQNRTLVIHCDKCDKDYTISYHMLYLREKWKTEICLNCRPYGKSQMEHDMNVFLTSLNLNFIRNTRSIIKDDNQYYEIDFYLPDHKLGIEINDFRTHSELDKESNYHLTKTVLCNEKGIQLIHIFQDDWILKRDIVKSRLLNILKLNNDKIYARKCILKEVDNKTSKLFLINNHLQGNVNSKINIGLYYNDELVSLMTFGNLRKNMNQNSIENVYELYRFCNKLNVNVIGAAGKLFNYFIKVYNPIKVISYAKRDWTNFSDKNLYINIGFNFIRFTSIGYSYVSLGNDKYDRLKRYNRFEFRKDVLVKSGYDKNKTENEIMNEIGMFRIYDTGNLKFEYIC